MISVANIYWLAGFLDGEGYFGLNRSTCRVVVGQKDAWPLEKMKRLVGGNLYRHKGTGGRLYYALHVTGKRAASVMMTVYSLMSPRRQEKIAGVLAKWRLIPRRGEVNRTKTHCTHGHEFTVANTIVKKTGRDCRTCQRGRQLKYNDSHRRLSFA